MTTADPMTCRFSSSTSMRPEVLSKSTRDRASFSCPATDCRKGCSSLFVAALATRSNTSGFDTSNSTTLAFFRSAAPFFATCSGVRYSPLSLSTKYIGPAAVCRPMALSMKVTSRMSPVRL